MSYPKHQEQKSEFEKLASHSPQESNNQRKNNIQSNGLSKERTNDGTSSHQVNFEYKIPKRKCKEIGIIIKECYDDSYLVKTGDRIYKTKHSNLQKMK
jgi:hypothetical protein